jgi:ERCC4-type nuclease
MKIIRDTREKVGYWDFSFFGYEMEVVKLKTGDYSISGYEDILCIERKKSTAEMAINCGTDSPRFEAELERMQHFEYKYLILEFTVSMLLDFPKGSGIPKRFHKTTGKEIKVRMNGGFIMKKLKEYEDKYGIDVIFAGSQAGAVEVAEEIFREVLYETRQNQD